MAAKNAERGLVEQWREILSLHARTQCELDRVLHGHGLCASDFEVLDVLAEGVASGATVPTGCRRSPIASISVRARCPG